MAKSLSATQLPLTVVNDSGLSSSDNDVPVNQVTSFKGVLNKFVHVSETETGNSTPTSATQETKRQLDSSIDFDSDAQTNPKRRKGAPTHPQITSITTTTTKTIGTLESPAPRRITRSQSRSVSTTPDSPALASIKAEPDSLSPGAIATVATIPSTPSLTKRSRSRSRTQSQSQSQGRGRNRNRSTPRKGTSSPLSIPAANCLLRDTIPLNLLLLLVGVNPGILTGTTGYAYAHPSNLFWKLLHASGITTIRHPPSDTYRLPELYNVGNTNIVERPTRDASMLSKAEMDAGVPVLEKKIADKKPAVVCLVGKSIWESVWRARKGKNIRKEEFRYGWQDEGENMGKSEEWEGARVFVATTTSGLAAGMSYAEKLAVWEELGSWVRGQREAGQAQAQAQNKVKIEGEAEAEVKTEDEREDSAPAPTLAGVP
ncbi:uracil-DNA glycosylase-like protein [Aspergillus multicolor]|uniref:mismatch-specific DNA-glycosylase n=1 Tax=Aspergillus multicolor TaxID=41759 RepID=UPI003CCE0B97